MAQLNYGAVFAQPAPPSALGEVAPLAARASGDKDGATSAAISGLILGPLFLLAGARGMASANFQREVRAAMFGIGLSNVLQFGAEAAARTIRERRKG